MADTEKILKPEIRLTLGVEDFKALVSRKVVEVKITLRETEWRVQIALGDIDWSQMVGSIRDAIEEVKKAVDERQRTKIEENPGTGN